MKTALIIYADGSEDLEVTAAADVLTRGGVNVVRATLNNDDKNTDLSYLAHGTVVKTDGNLSKFLDKTFDVIVIPGGLPGSINCAENNDLISMLKEQKKSQRLIAAICAAPGFVLYDKGIISDTKATCYPGCEKGLNSTSAPVEVSEDGKIITAKGPAFAILFGLKILELLESKNLADKIAKGMLVI